MAFKIPFLNRTLTVPRRKARERRNAVMASRPVTVATRLQPNGRSSSSVTIEIPEIVIESDSADSVFSQPAENVLKLNVGGCSYHMDERSVMKHCKSGFLQRFCLDDHDDRLTEPRLSAYLAPTDEYFFQRSFSLFEPVYRFCSSGQLHCPFPPGVCLEPFFDELAFWGVPKTALQQCAACAGRLCGEGSTSDVDDTLVDLKTARVEFDGMRCAGLRHALWHMFEGKPDAVYEKLYMCASISCIMLSLMMLVLGSLPAFQIRADNATEAVARVDAKPVAALELVEAACVAFFTAEYLVRLAVAPNRRAACADAMNVIDLVAIVPFYVELVVELVGGEGVWLKLTNFKQAFLVVRILRVLRVLRIFKLGRYSAGLRTFALTLKASGRQLSMMGFVFSIGVVFFSTLVYFAEKEEPSTKFSTIPDGFWWCLVTMTTVGYGDVVPVTTGRRRRRRRQGNAPALAGGKLVASFAIVSGVLVLALPLTVIVDNFMRIAHQQGHDIPLPPNRSTTSSNSHSLSAHSANATPGSLSPVSQYSHHPFAHKHPSR